MWSGGVISRRRFGVPAAFLLWVASIGALLALVRANGAADHLLRFGGGQRAQIAIHHLHVLAVMWGVALTALQIASLLTGVGVLRVGYRLRAAVCFAASGVLLVFLNALWLFGLLVWMRMSGRAG